MKKALIGVIVGLMLTACIPNPDNEVREVPDFDKEVDLGYGYEGEVLMSNYDTLLDDMKHKIDVNDIDTTVVLTKVYIGKVDSDINYCEDMLNYQMTFKDGYVKLYGIVGRFIYKDEYIIVYDELEATHESQFTIFNSDGELPDEKIIKYAYSKMK